MGRLRGWWLVAAAFGCAGIATAAETGRARDALTFDEHAMRRATPRRVRTKDAQTARAAPPVNDSVMAYHGGPVMLGTVNVYYIWYGNWAGNTAPTILTDLAKHIGASPYERINTTYSDASNRHVTGDVAFAGAVEDAYSHGAKLSDEDVESIVEDHAGKDLPLDAGAIYFVLTSSDVELTTGFCTQYCGWHAHGTIGGAELKYAFVGNPEHCLNACAPQKLGPNDNAGADGMASIIAHELEEAITNPELNAWYDERGYENADKCAWTFGATSTAANGAHYNLTLGERQFMIQQNWVNNGNGYCSMEEAPPPPPKPEPQPQPQPQPPPPPINAAASVRPE